MLVFKRSFGKGSVSLREMGNYYSRGNREHRTDGWNEWRLGGKIAEVRTKRDTRITFGETDINYPN